MSSLEQCICPSFLSSSAPSALCSDEVSSWALKFEFPCAFSLSSLNCSNKSLIRPQVCLLISTCYFLCTSCGWFLVERLYHSKLLQFHVHLNTLLPWTQSFAASCLYSFSSLCSLAASSTFQSSRRANSSSAALSSAIHLVLCRQLSRYCTHCSSFLLCWA